MLVNIDRNYIRAYSPDPVTFEPYPNDYWNTSVQAGVIKIIDGMTWKLMTGDPGCSLIDKQDQGSLEIAQFNKYTIVALRTFGKPCIVSKNTPARSVSKCATL